MDERVAVILAGGLGERLKPITEIMPKALAPINGIPMLELLLNQLEKLDFNKIVILSGYKSNLITKYLRRRMKIDHIILVNTPLNFTPAERLLEARKIIGDKFLLLYCDNYIAGFENFKPIGANAQEINMIIEKRAAGNVKKTGERRILYTDGDRSAEYSYVELGYITVASKLFFETLAEENNLQITLAKLSISGLVTAKEIDKDGCTSISNLNQFNAHNQNRHKILLDRDGIINRKMKPREYLNNFDDFSILSKNWEALKILGTFNFDFIVATNQPGLALGSVSPQFIREFHEHLYSELSMLGINVYAFYVCQHHWKEECQCRKPQAGMLLQAINDFAINPKRTMYIGDEEKDATAARNANIESLIVNESPSSKAPYGNIFDALPYILNRFEIE